MLGTRIILMGLTSDPAEKSAADSEAEVLCAANNQIPFFWLLLFKSAQMRYYKLPDDQESTLGPEAGTEYPVLIGSRQDVVDTLVQRAKQLAPFLSSEDKGVLNDWQAFFYQQSFPVIAMDTYELWSNMQEPALLSEQLSVQLKLLELLDSGDVAQSVEELKASGLWTDGGKISLAGFGW